MTRADRPRLVRVDAVAHPEGGMVLTTPRGRTFRLVLGERELAEVLAACDGSTPVSEIVAGRERPAELASLVDMLTEEGCLSLKAPGPADADWARFAEADAAGPARTTVVVLGTGAFAATTVELLGRVGDRFGEVRTASSPNALTGLDPSATVVLACLDRFDPAELSRLERACASAGLRWSHFHFEAERGWFGPHHEPGGGPTFGDLHGRRLAATADPAALRARSQPAPGDAYLPPPHERFWMVSAFLVDVERWLAGAGPLGSWHEVELDPVDLGVERRPVLPLPDAPPSSPPPGLFTDPAGPLTDRRLGIVTRLEKIPSHPLGPPGMTTVHAAGCNIGRISRWRNDPSGGGSSFGDPEAAAKAAVGELVERYCGNIVRADLLRRASHRELTRAGEHAVDPERLALFSAAQYAAPGFPFAPMTRDTPIHWVRGRNLTRNVPAWLPASLVYVNWYKTSPEDAPPTNGTAYAGVAAGVSLDDAVLSGLQEVVERHSTMVWWLNRPTLPAVVPSPRLAEAWPNGTPDGPLRAWLIHLDNEFSIPVMAGVVEDADQGLFTIGFASRSDPEDAALKAWAEGLTLQEIARDLAGPDNQYGRAVANGRLPDQGLKPWRADRRYLDDYRPDFRDVPTLICQTQVHLDPRAVERIRPWVDVPLTRAVSDLPRLGGADLDTYRKAVEAPGYEVFYADITTPDVAAAGLSVTRTLVPGLVGNFPAAFPFLGRGVVQDSAVRLGWRSEPRPEGDLTTIPIPHA
ncbi:YcaO-like family protein [Phytomonospora endophytica]|uniref:Ribosomal protein S12 methylthiotransferase accessory factor n=1 Tax=Phytomonospora endophytica TaxID=714109 RepID=A0A841FSS2_9ACTN|nr:YcaO-like family protein [Phytomonospora endophytica]MBB6038854.1 ribosomal protein S12 methylthiotransferase accessory factor [Phytomonospora endophytica]GIG68351.1 hypothetical protein Pen01_46460 [Phytomonospora endophytica]